MIDFHLYVLGLQGRPEMKKTPFNQITHAYMVHTSPYTHAAKSLLGAIVKPFVPTCLYLYLIASKPER